MKITVCIGSSCHIKGSRQVVEQLQQLISENNLKDRVELAGTFCMGKCQRMRDGGQRFPLRQPRYREGLL